MLRLLAYILLPGLCLMALWACSSNTSSPPAAAQPTPRSAPITPETTRTRPTLPGSTQTPSPTPTPSIPRGTWGALPSVLSDSGVPNYAAEARASFTAVSGASASNGVYFDLTGVTTAHSRGATGAGVLVTVIDGLVDFQIPDLDSTPDKLTCLSCPRLSDYTGSDGAIRYGSINHGLGIAGIIAADRDGHGILGVAYDAKIQILASGAGSPSFTAPPSIDLDRYADGTLGTLVEGFLRRARTLGQRSQITNISWGWTSVLSDKRIFDSDPSNDNDPLYTAANVRAAFAPILPELRQYPQIVVVSAGNLHGRTQRLCQDASCPTRVVNADSTDILSGLPYFLQELRGLWVAAVAVDHNGAIASFSNRCGLTKAYCIAAPGVNIWAPYISTFGTTSYSLALRSGTSFSAPFVVGSLALLIDHFRGQLSLTEVVARLFATATKTGRYADSNTYGQGLINLDAATRPVGSMTLALGEHIEALRAPLKTAQMIAPPLLRAALHRTLHGREVALFDELHAPFFVPLSALLSESPALTPRPFEPFWARRYEQTVVGGAPAGQTPRWSRTVTPVGGGMLFFGHGSDLEHHFVSQESFSTPYLSLAQGGMTLGGETRFGDVTVRGRVFFGTSPWQDQHLPQSTPDVQGLLLETAFPMRAGLHLFAQGGAVREAKSFLGGHLTGRSAHTVFGGWAARLNLTENTTLQVSHHMGLTQAESVFHPVIREMSAVHTSAFEVAVETQGLFAPEDKVRVRLRRPLQVDTGRLKMRIATGRTPQGEILWEEFLVDLAPSGHMVDVEALYAHPVGRGQWTASVSYARDPEGGTELRALLAFSQRF